MVKRALWMAGIGIAGVAGWMGLLAPTPAQASGDRIYTVANFPVDATADNAVDAKEQALADGQRSAFRSLLKRLVPVTAYKRLPKFANEKPEDFVANLAVRNEQNSSTEYLATIDFTFDARRVRALLQRYGIPIVEQQAPVLTVIPVFGAPDLVSPSLAKYGKARGKPARRFERVWRQAWAGLDLKNALTPVVLKKQVTGMTPDLLGSMMNGDASVMAMVRGEIEGPVVFAVADVSEDRKKFLVRIIGEDSVGDIDLTRAFTLDPEDPSYTAESSAVVMLAMLEGRWKEVNKPAVLTVGNQVVAAAGTPVSFVVEFSGLREWQQLRLKIASTPGVQKFDTGVVSTRGAEVMLEFPGGVQALAARLARDGIALRNDGGRWVVRGY